MGNMKGASIIAIREYIREHYGEEGLARVLAALSAEDAGLCRRDQAVNRIPAALVRRLYQAAIHTVGGGTLDFCRQVGAAVAIKDMPRFFRYTLAKTNPVAIFRFMGVVWRLYYDSGKFNVVKNEAGYVVLEIRDFQDACDEICSDICGYCEAILGLFKLKNPRVTHTSCLSHGAAVCVFEGRWDVS